MDSEQADYEFLPNAAGAGLKGLSECTGPTGSLGSKQHLLEHIPKAPPNAPEAEPRVHRASDHISIYR